MNDDIYEYSMPYTIAHNGAPRDKPSTVIKTANCRPVAFQQRRIIFVQAIPANRFPQVTNCLCYDVRVDNKLPILHCVLLVLRGRPRTVQACKLICLRSGSPMLYCTHVEY